MNGKWQAAFFRKRWGREKSTAELDYSGSGELSRGKGVMCFLSELGEGYSEQVVAAVASPDPDRGHQVALAFAVNGTYSTANVAFF